jgi:hypothetical protein
MTDNLDEEALRGKPKPPKPFKIVIDKKDYEIADASPSGRDLLVLAGKSPPERFQIFERQQGGDLKPIPLDQDVDLAAPGKERFVTLPLDQTEGEGGSGTPRRDFRMSEGDTIALDALGLIWETIRSDNIAAVVIRQYPLPSGYNHEAADIHVRVPLNYPDAQLDMVYVYPPLSRADGRQVGALTDAPFAGQVWQQWSRHRTGPNPWRPGIDDLATHLALVDHWFAREFDLAKAA